MFLPKEFQTRHHSTDPVVTSRNVCWRLFHLVTRTVAYLSVCFLLFVSRAFEGKWWSGKAFESSSDSGLLAL
jgi:hypothetical protein